MRIGIDISQIVHEGTGVGEYTKKLVKALITLDQNNEYILFGASLRRSGVFRQYFDTVKYVSKNVKLVVVPIPPTILDILWNIFHIFPIEWFTGNVDIFWSSDWTQPPLAHARSVTTIHDVSFLMHPETFAKTILDVQKRRLWWVKRECKAILCDSEATKNDAVELLGISEKKLQVVYPGFH